MLGILIVLYGVVGSERTIKRVWDISQQANLSGKPHTGRFTEKGTLFLCLLRNLFFFENVIYGGFSLPETTALLAWKSIFRLEQWKFPLCWQNCCSGDFPIKGFYSLCITTVTLLLSDYRRGVSVSNNSNWCALRVNSSGHGTDNHVQCVNAKPYTLCENIILILTFIIALKIFNVFVCLFRSFPFRRLYCFPVVGRGKDRKGKE